jgi:hypothetical protein
MEPTIIRAFQTQERAEHNEARQNFAMPCKKFAVQCQKFAMGNWIWVKSLESVGSRGAARVL